MLKLEKPWTSQPQGAVSVDWSNPIAAKARAIVLPFQGGARVWARGALAESPTLANGSGVSYAPEAGGIGVGTSTPTTNTHRLHRVGNATNTVWETPAAKATWGVLLVRFGNNANGNAPIFSNDSASVSPFSSWSLFDGSGGGAALFSCSAGGSYRSLSVAGWLDNNKLRTFVGRYDGAGLDGFRSGIKHTSTTACTGNIAYPNDSNRGPALGNFWNYTPTARSFNGRIFLAALWDVALTDAEIRDWDADPWQLFAPRRIWVPTSVAAGGNAYTLTAESGTFAYTGGDATLAFNRKVAADSGTFSYTGGDAGLKRGWTLAADSGTFAYTGGDAGLAFNRKLIADGGTFAYAGGDATLTYTPVGGALNAESGTFSYTGGDATLAFNRKLAADSGTFSYTGGNATLSRGWTLAADSGTFAYLGGDATFPWVRAYTLAADSGTFTLDGGDATFSYSNAPVVVARPQGGGKSRKTRKRKIQVDIDGEIFDVESEAEAEAVLAKAAEQASETAKLAIERAAKAKRRPVRKIVRDAEKALSVPSVSVPPSLQSYADQMIGRIRAEYQSALSAIEISAHLARREREIEDDDEDILMLL